MPHRSGIPQLCNRTVTQHANATGIQLHHTGITPPCDTPVVQQADTAETLPHQSGITPPCDRAVTQHADTARIPSQHAAIWPSCNRTITGLADSNQNNGRNTRPHRHATGQSHHKQIQQGIDCITSLSGHYATHQSHDRQIPPRPSGTRSAYLPQCNWTVTPQTDSRQNDRGTTATPYAVRPTSHKSSR